MKYLLLLIPMLIGCNNSSKKQPKNIKETTETSYKLKNTDFPVEIIEAFVPFASATVKADNKIHMSYELTILNNRTIPFILKKVEVYNANAPDSSIAEFDSEYLNIHFVRHGLTKEKNPLELRGNEFGVVNIWLTLEKSDSNLTQIFHKLIFERINDNQETKTYQMEVGRLNIPPQTEVLLGLPFKKGKWLYAQNHHRDSRFITEGKASYSQRYGIDWILLDNEGVYVKNESEQNENWITYGVELLAVSDGKVVDVKDGIAENTPLSENMAVSITRETIAGNYIVIDIGNDIYAVYAHLIPSSLKVKNGDLVKKGQVIGLLGNSGNSDAPHLHFHLETKSNITLGGEGVPYHFSEFKQLVKYRDDELEALFDSMKFPLKDLSPSIRFNELPIGNGIVEF